MGIRIVCLTLPFYLSLSNSKIEIFEFGSMKAPSTMHTKDVTRSLEIALPNAGLSKKERPKLLSDKGTCYISQELKQFIHDKNMKHSRGRPMHKKTQGKIDRYHRSMKNSIKLEHYYFPAELKQ